MGFAQDISYHTLQGSMMAKQSTAQLINADSGKTDYYTPGYILQAASDTMAGNKARNVNGYLFELDAASSVVGNGYVNAIRFFSEENDALTQEWRADSVWLNHPYSREFNRAWIRKAVEEYIEGRAKQICMITWASTSEQWMHPLFNFPMCFLKRRVKFIDPGRVLTGATKSSVVTYMGPNVSGFIENFSPIGHVMFPSGFVLYMANETTRSREPADLLVHEYQ